MAVDFMVASLFGFSPDRLRAVVGAAFVLACHAVFAQPEFALANSRIATIGMPVHEATWIDNVRVVFYGVDQEKIAAGKPFVEYPRPQDERARDSSYRFDQFVWNVQTGVIERPPHPMIGPCAYNGIVGYVSEKPSDDPKRYWYFGIYGKEKQRALPEPHWINPLSCRLYDAEPPWKLNGKDHGRIPLLEKHGYIDLGPSQLGGKRPVLIPHESARDAVKLTPLWNSSRPWHYRYVPFADAYLVRSSDSLPTAFTMKPNGELTRVLFPADSPKSAGLMYYTRRGFFYYNNQGRNNVEDLRTSGGYLLSETGLSRIVAGLLDSVGVSPDGCRVAFSHAPSAKAHYDGIERSRKGGLSVTTMKVVQLCDAQEGNQK